MNKITDILTSNQIKCSNSGIIKEIPNIDCEYAEIAGKDAAESWEILKQELKSGHPVVTNLPVSFQSVSESQIESDLAKYPHKDLQKWFEDNWRGYDFENEYDELIEIYESMGQSLPPEAEPEPNHEFLIPRNILTKKFKPNIGIVAFFKIPFWEIPIYWQYGGWNACPYPDEQARIMKYWYDNYGAELWGLTEDTIEMKVKYPPQDRETAFKLAKEQMAYCDDIVFQGSMTVERLSKSLVQSTSWYFWWD